MREKSILEDAHPHSLVLVSFEFSQLFVFMQSVRRLRDAENRVSSVLLIYLAVGLKVIKFFWSCWVIRFGSKSLMQNVHHWVLSLCLLHCCNTLDMRNSIRERHILLNFVEEWRGSWTLVLLLGLVGQSSRSLRRFSLLLWRCDLSNGFDPSAEERNPSHDPLSPGYVNFIDSLHEVSHVGRHHALKDNAVFDQKLEDWPSYCHAKWAAQRYY